ncbi:hypothetical protein [Bradyrhizobium sp.]|uniref:hypothetical protein n=1 Tax=Bradyrhizobium sp. TaxID=376 RepID=UPI0007C8F5F5|nr:hypothetical protein [Bradyrhizobium sp.]
MKRVIQDRPRPGLLHDPAYIHDGNTAADLPDHTKVVRDEEHRQSEPVTQVHHQIEHIGLHRNVEGRDRLVGDDDCGHCGGAAAASSTHA